MSSLGRQAARGGVVTLAGQIVRVAIQFGGILLLARLLTPEDFGLVAMVVAIVGLGEVIRDFGLTSAAVQAPTLSKEEKDNLFWINTGIGVILTLLVIVFAPVLVAVYNEPRILGITYLIASTFAINGASTQFRAHLNRELKFKALVLVDLVSSFLGLAIAFCLAIMGAGYWALGVQQVIGATAGLAAAAAAARWMPGWIHTKTPMKVFLKYGINLMGVQILTYASKNIDSIIIGSKFGEKQLGFYDRAFQILMLPLMQINAPATKVALPILSKLQNEKNRYDYFLLRGQKIMVYAISCVLALVAALAPTLIPLMLGSQWLATVPIFQLLALGGIAQVADYASYWVFLSKGLTASNLRLTLISRPLVILFIAIGSIWGVLGVAAGYSIGLLLIWPLGLWWLGRASNAPVYEMFLNGLRALMVNAFAGSASVIACYFVRDQSMYIRLGTGFLSFTATLVMLYIIWPAFREDTKQIRMTLSLIQK